MHRLDTLTPIETPEGVELSLSAAGPVPRALAWVLDAMIRFAFLLAVVMVAGYFGQMGYGLMLLMTFAVEWFYPVFFEVWRGYTPGKRQLGLMVVQDDGTPVTLASSLVRNLLRVVDFLPLFYGLGAIVMASHSRFKRLGDMAAGTVVVHVLAQESRTQLPQVDAQLPPLALSIEEQRAVLDFAERSSSLAPDRVRELAENLTGLRGQAAIKQAMAYAQGLSSR